MSIPPVGTGAEVPGHHLRRSGNLTALRELPPLSKPAEVWGGHRRVPVERFGSDHWHQLLHFGEGGTIARLHWADGPTLLTDAELWGHTDLDVIDDLTGAGFIHQFGDECRVSAVGAVVRAALEAHLRAGGNYVNFDGSYRSQRIA